MTSLMKLALCAILAFGAALTTQAGDASGTWSWSIPGRDGAPARQSTLKLKVEGDKVTGTLVSPGRQGNPGRETAIEDAKISGDEISFKVTREFNNNKVVTKYVGKVSGDTIKGKMEFDRNGEAQSRDWEAKREADKK